MSRFLRGWTLCVVLSASLVWGVWSPPAHAGGGTPAASATTPPKKSLVPVDPNLQLRDFMLQNLTRELTGMSVDDPGVVEAMLRAAGEGSAKVKIEVAQALADLARDDAGARLARPELLRLLSLPLAQAPESREKLRHAALASLQTLQQRYPPPDPETVAALETVLASGDAEARALAAEFAASWSPAWNVEAPGVLAALRENLAHENLETRARAALALVRLQGAEAVDTLPVLREYLDQADLDQAFAVMRILPVFGPAGGDLAPLLPEHFDHGHPSARWAAVRAMGAMGAETMRRYPEVMRALVAQVAYPDLSVGSAAAVSIGLLGPEAPFRNEAGAALQKGLQSPWPQVRESAAWALTRLDPDNVRLLSPELREALPRVKAKVEGSYPGFSW